MRMESLEVVHDGGGAIGRLVIDRDNLMRGVVLRDDRG